MPRFDHWVPVRLLWRDAQPRVDWCRVGPRNFSEPFFEQTIRRVLAQPANLLFRRETPIEALGQWAGEQPGLTPAGFIFHLSRCGSTLLTQMLAAVSQNLVISEAKAIDGVLRAGFRAPGLTEERRMEWLQWMVSALGQVRQPGQRHLFIKFDCWHARFLPLIRRAFPAVPWIFIYRDPVEVLMSHARLRGPQTIPGVLEGALFGWSPEEIRAIPAEDYPARVLARICEAALEQFPAGNGKLVNYRQLPSLVNPTLLEFWRVRYPVADGERMAAAAAQDAKNPLLPFEDDTDAKRSRVPKKLRAAARKWLAGPIAQLERLRQEQHAG